MEISASEISLLCQRISSAIIGYTLSSVYSIQGGILLRLRHETKEEQLIAISSFAPWLTTKNFSLEQAEFFVSGIRERLERSSLSSVTMEGNERIATLHFESRSGTRSNLHAEFFGGGNLILTDESDVILLVRTTQHFRHRSLVPGQKYVLPPERGRSLESLDDEFLLSELLNARSEKKQDELKAIRWFGRLVGTSRKFVEEIFYRSGVDPTTPIHNINQDQISKLSDSSRQLSVGISKSLGGYLLLPLKEESDISVDACPLVPYAWSVLQHEGIVELREFRSFNDALDQAQVESFLFEKRTKASKEIRSKAEELESAISKQGIEIRRNSDTGLTLRALGTEMMNGTRDEVSDQLVKDLESLGVLERDKIRKDLLRFSSEPKSFLESYKNPAALASRLFSEAKKLEQKNLELEQIREKLSKKRNTLLEQTRSSEERAEKRLSVERRARQWYERYRWFLTSDLKLAVGGRDATSNSVIVNKYVDQDCLVFHADLHGSPFFVLRDARKESLNMSQDTEQELAQATASFSRAWRDELGSADAYWVEPQQIKKSAPSGEYLPRGSFFIEGKKNLVKHLKIELGVGLMQSRIMPREKREDIGNENLIESLVIVCGPSKALSKYCVSLVKISPGHERSNAVARRIKQHLISGIHKEEQSRIKDLAKKISVDEIIHSLPAGSYKIISEKR